MTEKELFKNAMRQNMKDPAEQTAAELREGKRNYGYVRGSGLKYAAAAAVLALAVGAGTLLFLRSGDSVPKAAEENISQAESVAPAVSEAPADNQQDAAMEVYRGFWNEVSAAPENYWSAVQVLSQKIWTTDPKSVRSYWLAEDQTGQPASGKNLSQEMAAFFSKAGQVEYLGFHTDAADPGGELAQAVNTEIYLDKGIVSLSTRSEVPQNGLSGLSANYQMGKKGAMLMIVSRNNEGTEGEITRHYYYRVSSPDGNYPCYDGEKFTAPDWNTSTADQAYIMSAKELEDQHGEKYYRVTDAEDRISFEISADFDGVLPKVNISSITLPEGVSITDGEFRIHLDKADNYGKHSAVDHPVAVTEDIVKNGVTVDLSNYAAELSKEDIVAVRVDAWFNTNEHTAASYEKYNSPDGNYAYHIVDYIGIDRTKAQ
ncbi:hypothetical protein SAMN02910317_02512 [Ruminococcaceae bacterium FB2012]|nr:hypothetical protein SAMN02910317_02512 [Ruminococcaceae bacterium FB2012]